MRRPKTALVLTMLALLAAGLGTRALLPRLRDAVAGNLVQLAVVVAEARARSMDVPTEVEPAAPGAVLVPADVSDDGGSRERARATVPRTPSGGAIDIPEDRVARLTEKQLRSLRPANVVDAGGRASGVRLHGIGALGVGLADSDVVTSIDGLATPDVSTGTDAALRAWASGEEVAHATVLREGRTVLVTVHIPKHLRLAQGLRRSAREPRD